MGAVVTIIFIKSRLLRYLSASSTSFLAYTNITNMKINSFLNYSSPRSLYWHYIHGLPNLGFQIVIQIAFFLVKRLLSSSTCRRVHVEHTTTTNVDMLLSIATPPTLFSCSGRQKRRYPLCNRYLSIISLFFAKVYHIKALLRREEVPGQTREWAQECLFFCGPDNH